jgi:hypothetical protein
LNPWLPPCEGSNARSAPMQSELTCGDMSTALAPQTGFGLLTEQERNDERAERPAQRVLRDQAEQDGADQRIWLRVDWPGAWRLRPTSTTAVPPTTYSATGTSSARLQRSRSSTSSRPFQRINQTLWRTARSGGVTSGPRSVRRPYQKIPADAFASPQGGKPSPDMVEIGVTRGNACPESVPQDGWQAKRRLG